MKAAKSSGCATGAAKSSGCATGAAKSRGCAMGAAKGRGVGDKGQSLNQQACSPAALQ